MPTSTSRLSYPDCESFFNACLEDEKGARLPFLTLGQANQFRVRLNYFRTIVRADNAKIHEDPEHPMHGRSEYDPITVTVRGPDAADEYWVYGILNRSLAAGAIEKLSEVEGE